MRPLPSGGQTLNWVGNIGLLLIGVASVIAATQYAALLPSVPAGGYGKLFSDLAPAVSWVLVIIGWGVVSRDHNARERRKEVRAIVERLVKDACDIEIRFYDYIPTEAQSKEGKSLQLRLKSDLQRLGMTLDRLANSENLDVREAMIELRKAVTSRGFDSSSRLPCDLDSAWALEVQTATNTLIKELESAFRDAHQ